MKINFGEKTVEVAEPLSVYDAAAGAELVSRSHVAAKVNGEVRAMTYVLDADADVQLLTFADEVPYCA